MRGAEGDGDGVGHVGRRGRLGETEQGLHAALHLLLARVAVAGEELLDRVGSELGERDGAASDGQKNDAAGVAHGDGGSRVPVMGVEGLDAGERGRGPREQIGEIAIEFVQTIGEAVSGAKADDAGFDETRGCGGVRDVDHGEAGQLKPGIDAEDAHGHRVSAGQRAGALRSRGAGARVRPGVQKGV